MIFSKYTFVFMMIQCITNNIIVFQMILNHNTPWWYIVIKIMKVRTRLSVIKRCIQLLNNKMK